MKAATRAALDAFVKAAEALDAAWEEELDTSAYPARLPSFDEFVGELQAWKESIPRKANTYPFQRRDGSWIYVTIPENE